MDPTTRLLLDSLTLLDSEIKRTKVALETAMHLADKPKVEPRQCLQCGKTLPPERHDFCSSGCLWAWEDARDDEWEARPDMGPPEPPELDEEEDHL